MTEKAKLREHAYLAQLPPTIGASANGVIVGIGDDAAVLSASQHHLVWTIDASVEGVHFTRAIATYEEVGYRATIAAASDLAAMGATPRGLLAALVLPSDFGADDLDAIIRGQRRAADAIGAPLIGGNLARGAALAITTTALGEASAPLLRSGARAGDRVFLSGPVGLAAVGLRALLAGRRDVPSACLDAWTAPRAHLAEGLRAVPIATAAIDVSDGLFADLGHIARASAVDIVIDAALVLALGGEALTNGARALGQDAAHLALAGGEDYVLAVTGPASLGEVGYFAIGEVIAGPGDVRVLGAPDAAFSGFDHFER